MGGHKERWELGCIWQMYFVSRYENRRMKSVEIALRMRKG
jgi:hypothetical protein